MWYICFDVKFNDISCSLVFVMKISISYLLRKHLQRHVGYLTCFTSFIMLCKVQNRLLKGEDKLYNTDEERIVSQFADIVLLGQDPHELATVF